MSDPNSDQASGKPSQAEGEDRGRVVRPEGDRGPEVPRGGGGVGPEGPGAGRVLGAEVVRVSYQGRLEERPGVLPREGGPDLFVVGEVGRAEPLRVVPSHADSLVPAERAG